MSIQLPSVLSAVLQPNNTFQRHWFSWVDAVTDRVNLDYGAGITTARPGGTLPTGARYFDTTLGLPIWWDGAAWILADGSPA